MRVFNISSQVEFKYSHKLDGIKISLFPSVGYLPTTSKLL